MVEAPVRRVAVAEGLRDRLADLVARALSPPVGPAAPARQPARLAADRRHVEQVGGERRRAAGPRAPAVPRPRTRTSRAPLLVHEGFLRRRRRDVSDTVSFCDSPCGARNTCGDAAHTPRTRGSVGARLSARARSGPPRGQRASAAVRALAAWPVMGRQCSQRPGVPQPLALDPSASSWVPPVHSATPRRPRPAPGAEPGAASRRARALRGGPRSRAARRCGSARGTGTTTRARARARRARGGGRPTSHDGHARRGRGARLGRAAHEFGTGAAAPRSAPVAVALGRVPPGRTRA